MQAIQTRYIPCTNTKPSRIKAWCARGSIAVHYPDELSGDAVHRFAVDCLVARFCDQDLKQYGTPPEKNPWKRPYVTGGLPNGNYAHVFLGAESDELADALASCIASLEDEAFALNREPLKSAQSAWNKYKGL